ASNAPGSTGVPAGGPGLYEFTLNDVLNEMREIGPHMPLLAPMLVVPAGRDGADAVAAGAAAANEVPPPPPPPVTSPPAVPPTHTSSSTLGPSTTVQDTPVRDPTHVREPTPVKEPTPSPVREPTTFWEPTPEPPRPPSPPPCTRSKEVGPTTSTAENDSISIEDPLRPLESWPTYQTTPFNTTEGAYTSKGAHT
nr:hypothetical protein [Tanacetum cinerariifolium]